MTLICAHHWDIATATSPTSQGICRHCGAVKAFTNTVYDLNFWEHQRGDMQLSMRRNRRSETAEMSE